MTHDEQAIRELVDQWMAASKAADTPTRLSLLSDDVLFMVPGQEPFGKESFAAMANGMKDTSIEGTIDIQELRVLGDWAWMRNRLSITVTPPNGEPQQRSGYTLTILRKQDDGHWVIARDANLLTSHSKPE